MWNVKSITVGVGITQKITGTTLDLLFWLKYSGNHVANNFNDLLSSLKWAFKLNKSYMSLFICRLCQIFICGKKKKKKEQTNIAIV